MKRLYYLTKNIESTHNISDDLHEAGVTDWNFHVVSKDEKGLLRRHIHSANVLQKTDLIHSLEQGILRGLAYGVVIAFILSFVSIHGRPLSYDVLLGVIFIGLIFGSFHGVLFGYQNENYQLKPFHDKIEQGYYLIIVDTPKSHTNEVISLMEKLHPEAVLCTQGSSWVWPFSQAKPIHF